MCDPWGAPQLLLTILVARVLVLAACVEVVEKERVDCVVIEVTKSVTSSVRLRSTTARDTDARFE